MHTLRRMEVTRGRYTGGKPPLDQSQKGPSPNITVRVTQALRNDLERVSEAIGRGWADVVRDGIRREVIRLRRLVEKRAGK
jgi:hypothetical protein